MEDRNYDKVDPHGALWLRAEIMRLIVSCESTAILFPELCGPLQAIEVALRNAYDESNELLELAVQIRRRQDAEPEHGG